MTPQPGRPTTTGSRRKPVLAAGVVLVATLAIAAATADTDVTRTRQFFGLWRMRHFIACAGGLWLAATFALAAVSRRAILRWILASGSALFAIGLLEVVGLIGLVDYAELLDPKKGSDVGGARSPHIELSGETYQDTYLRWGIDAAPIPFRYRTDQHGFRNAEDLDAADVYLLGDSFLVAGMVPFEDTIAARLADALDRDVMNVSLIGLSVQEERDIFAELAPPLDGRLVVQFVFEGNDLIDSAAYRARGKGASSAPPSLKDRSLVHRLLLRVQRWSHPVDPVAARRSAYIGADQYTFLWVSNDHEGLSKQIPHVLAALGDTARNVRAAGGEYAVVLIPSKLRVLGPICRWPDGTDIVDLADWTVPIEPAVEAWCAEQQVPFLSLAPALSAAAAARQIPWLPGDTHWNALGHDVAARTVASWPAVASSLKSE